MVIINYQLIQQLAMVEQLSINYHQLINDELN